MDITQAGEGVVKVDDRVYFVAGALTDETIRFVAGRKRRGRYQGLLQEILVASPDRVSPVCEYFGVCGGCSLQHLDITAQRKAKEKVLLDNLQRIGRTAPQHVLPVLAGEPWHYRRKARPGCKFVPKKGGMLVGFREQGSAFLTSLRHCHTLEERLSRLLDPLHDLVGKLDCYNQVPQIEFAAADNGVALVLRHLVPLTDSDRDSLEGFARQFSVNMLTQAAGPGSIMPLWPLEPDTLTYRLETYDLTLSFAPADFIQVNGEVNAAMIDQALSYLSPGEGDHVLDLFCGLGNFTLSLARSGARVSGVEGDESLVEKGRANAKANGLDHVHFEKMNLHDESVAGLASVPFNKLLLDPPRSGALEVVTHLVGAAMPETIVYISCNPATLARDAEILVHRHGYTLSHAGAIDMFPHTAHVESIAVFRLNPG